MFLCQVNSQVQRIIPTVQTAYAGDEVMIICRSSVQVIWEKNGRFLGNNVHFIEPNVYYFQVFHATEEDTGTYMCIGSSNKIPFMEKSMLYVGGKLFLAP